MQLAKRMKNIVKQLKVHAPFTFFGAVVGLACMLIFKDANHGTSENLFKVFHPLHVVLSAMVTAALFNIGERKKHFLAVLLIGYFGSIGVATLSDSVIPFIGESVLGVTVPTHSHSHTHHEHEGIECDIDHATETAANETHTEEHAAHEDHTAIANTDHDHEQEAIAQEVPKHSLLHRLHLGFIEEWYAVTPAALLGVFIAYFLPHTKFPHAAHVLISTWASSAHILMNTHREFDTMLIVGMLVVLFLAVWLPCCISDIVFPMLFIDDAELEKHLKHAHGH